jgi:hypothetical protein
MAKCPITGRFLPTMLEVGKKYHRWTVLGLHFKNNGGNLFWECQCECGTIKDVSGHRILSGESKSCGCYRYRKGQNSTHGLRKHPLYSVWRGIKNRCLNPKAPHWPDYGSRGIQICDRWKGSVQNFYDDMHEGYQKGLHIGRINNDGNYEPTNCRWETPLQNSNNKRSNVYVTHDGRTHTPAEWARELFKKANTIQARIRRGKKDSDALFW